MAPVKTDGYDIQVSEAAGFSSNGLNIIVSADDPALVASTAKTVVDALAANPDLANLTSDLVQATAEIQVTVDPNKAIAVGLTAAQVANEVRTALVADDRDPGDVRGRPAAGPGRPGGPGAVDSVESLRELPVGTVAKVPLGDVATVEQVDVQGSITRIDEAPAASITAEITSEDTGAVSLRSSGGDRRARGRRPDPGRRDRRAGGRDASSRARRSAACSPRWASPSCSST